MHFLKTFILIALSFIASAQAQEVKKKSSSSSDNSAYLKANAILSGYFNFVLKGKIKNYKRTNINGFLLIRMCSLNGKMNNTKIAVQTDGTFMLLGQKEFEGNISFFLGSLRDIPLYIKRDEVVTLEIDEEKWNKGGRLASGGLKIYGPSAGTSARMIDFGDVLEKHIYHNKFYSDARMNDSDMTQARLKQKNEALGVLDDYIKFKNISDTIFIEWYRNEIEMLALNDIGDGLFAGRINDTISYEQFLRYIRPVAYFKRPAFQNSSFYEFLKLFATDILIIGNVNQQYKNNDSGKLSHHLPFLKNYASGLVLDILYFDLYKSYMPQTSLNTLDSAISNNYIKSALQQFSGTELKPFTGFNLLDSMDKIPGGKAVAAKLKIILDRHPGNYIFLDFWSTWCGPCMSEMPVVPQLSKQFSDKPFTILFLSQNREEGDTKKTKELFNLEGEFLDLNDNETSVYNIALDFNALPAHYLIDNKGNLVTNSLPRITDGDTLNKALVEIINKIVSR